jgi:hypothetical protein
MGQIQFAHFAGQFGQQPPTVGFVVQKCRRFAVLQASPRGRRDLAHRAVDHVRTPRRLLEIDALGHLARAKDDQHRRRHQKEQEGRHDVADEEPQEGVGLVETKARHG